MALAHMVAIVVPYEGLSSVSVFTDRALAHLYACKLSQSTFSSDRVILATFDEGTRVSSAWYDCGGHTDAWFPESVT